MTKTLLGSRTQTIVFAAAVVFVFFFGLTIPLVGPDEPRYAQVAREMFERGDWITPTLGGFHWFEKPALLYWLQITFYNLFGVSEFAARFGSALFGLGTILCLWALGRNSDVSDEFPGRLALIAGTTVGILAFAHGASFDIILTFPMTAAMVSYFVYDRKGHAAALASFYFFIGVSLLAKGLVGVVFPLAIVGFFHFLAWRMPRRSVWVSLLWGTALAAVVAATWYLPMYLRNGWEFIDEFFIQHHFQRYTSNKYLHPQPFYFFLWVLPLMTIPWLPFFIAGLWDLAKTSFNYASKGIGRPSDLVLFAFAWLAVPVAFFSFSGSKLPGYVLPAVPPAIVIVAEYLTRFGAKAKWRSAVVPMIAGTTLVLVIISVIFVIPKFADEDSVKSLIARSNELGYRDMPVLMMHNVSHNAEFYAPGHIIRDADGKQKKVYGPLEVKREIETRGGTPLLVLVPLEHAGQLTASNALSAEILKDNGDWAIAHVGVK